MITMRNNRGDTLIEVLLGVAIFSLVAVGALSIMNQGSMMAQRSLEMTQVRNQIDGQAEALRFLNARYIAKGASDGKWLAIQQYIKNAGLTTIKDIAGICPDVAPPGSFIINTAASVSLVRFDIIPDYFHSASTFSQLRIDPAYNIAWAEGVWIEGIAIPGSKYIDFYIRTCWDSLGQSVPSTLSTTVRLYDPKI